MIGSGYIEHPPQRPFADRVLVQPPTIKPEEIPDWYDAHGVLHHGPRPPAGGRGGQGYPQRGGYSTVSNSDLRPPRVNTVIIINSLLYLI